MCKTCWRSNQTMSLDQKNWRKVSKVIISGAKDRNINGEYFPMFQQTEVRDYESELSVKNCLF